MLITWFPILALPVIASHGQARSEEANGGTIDDASLAEAPNNMALFEDQQISNCDEPLSDIEHFFGDQLLPDETFMHSPENSPDHIRSRDNLIYGWTEGQHVMEKRQAPVISDDDVNSFLEQMESKRAKPGFNSWGGKRAPHGFHSWGGKRSEENIEPGFYQDPTSSKIKRDDLLRYLKYANAPSTGNGGSKRRPAFNSWGGKRSPSGPAFNSWGGKRGPGFHSWGGKRGPGFHSWGGKRSSVSDDSSGNQDTAFDTWEEKRDTRFNSWGGKRDTRFNSWGGKRDTRFNSWGGKRGTRFNSWGGKRSTPFNSWGGKRGPGFHSWGGKRTPGFYSWGGKRSMGSMIEDEEQRTGEKSDEYGNTLKFDDGQELTTNPSSDGEPIILQKRDSSSQTNGDSNNNPDGEKSHSLAFSTSHPNLDVKENVHNLGKREVKENTSKERIENSPSELEKILPSLRDNAHFQKLVRDYKEREKKCSEQKSRLQHERIRSFLNFLLKISEKEPEETKKSIFNRMLIRASGSGDQPFESTFSHARRGAEFHSWGGKRGGLSNMKHF